MPGSAVAEKMSKFSIQHKNRLYIVKLQQVFQRVYCGNEAAHNVAVLMANSITTTTGLWSRFPSSTSFFTRRLNETYE